MKDKLPRISHQRDGRSGSDDSRKGSEDSRRGREVDAKEGEAHQRKSFLHSEVGVEDAVEDRLGREDGNVDGKKALVDADRPTSVPSISHIGEPDGTRTMLFSVLPLIGPTEDAGSPAIPDQAEDTLGSSQGEQNATDENRFGLWKSTASATAKLLLRAAKESVDAFPPLKSTVGGLCFILDNYEV